MELMYATPGSVGLDLCANAIAVIEPGEWEVIPTGITGPELFGELPNNTYAMVCPRSGLAASQGITVLNAPGIIDRDFGDEVCVVLINHGPREAWITPGERIAQAVFAKRVVNLDFGIRHGERVGGFGSTGR